MHRCKSIWGGRRWLSNLKKWTTVAVECKVKLIDMNGFLREPLTWLNPLHSGISVHILPTVVYTFPMIRKENFFQQSRASWVDDHFLNSHDFCAWLSSDTAKINKKPVPLRNKRVNMFFTFFPAPFCQRLSTFLTVAMSRMLIKYEHSTTIIHNRITCCSVIKHLITESESLGFDFARLSQFLPHAFGKMNGHMCHLRPKPKAVIFLILFNLLHPNINV